MIGKKPIPNKDFLDLLLYLCIRIGKMKVAWYLIAIAAPGGIFEVQTLDATKKIFALSHFLQQSKAESCRRKTNKEKVLALTWLFACCVLAG